MTFPHPAWTEREALDRLVAGTITLSADAEKHLTTGRVRFLDEL